MHAVKKKKTKSVDVHDGHRDLLVQTPKSNLKTHKNEHFN